MWLGIWVWIGVIGDVSAGEIADGGTDENVGGVVFAGGVAGRAEPGGDEVRAPFDQRFMRVFVSDGSGEGEAGGGVSGGERTGAGAGEEISGAAGSVGILAAEDFFDPKVQDLGVSGGGESGEGGVGFVMVVGFAANEPRDGPGAELGADGDVGRATEIGFARRVVNAVFGGLIAPFDKRDAGSRDGEFPRKIAGADGFARREEDALAESFAIASESAGEGPGSAWGSGIFGVGESGKHGEEHEDERKGVRRFHAGFDAE